MFIRISSQHVWQNYTPTNQTCLQISSLYALRKCATLPFNAWLNLVEYSSTKNWKWSTKAPIKLLPSGLKTAFQLKAKRESQHVSSAKSEEGISTCLVGCELCFPLPDWAEGEWSDLCSASAGVLLHEQPSYSPDTGTAQGQWSPARGGW